MTASTQPFDATATRPSLQAPRSLWSRRTLQRLRPHARRLIELGPHRGAHRVAVRAGLAMALPLATLFATGHLDLALYAVFGAFTALYGRSHTHLTRLRMQASAGAGLVLSVALGTAVGASTPREWLVLPVVAIVAGVATFVAQALDWHPPGALFFVFAVAATASVPAEPGRVLVAVAVAGASAVVAMAISTAGIALPRARTRTPTRLSVAFATTARRPGEFLTISSVVVAAVLAGLIPTVTGIGHPYWAMVSATAALGAADTVGHVVRAGQRVLGTVLGVAFAALLMAASAGPLEVIVIVVLLQVGAELFVMRNYGITMIFITPLALLMAQLAHPQDPSGLVRDRLVETLLGAAVGVGVSVTVAALRERARRSSGRAAPDRAATA